MVETITPRQAADIIASSEVEVIDVRDESEWSVGHIPNARPVPLDHFRSDPENILKRKESIIFVCAKGVRSLTAAKIAERLGFSKLYSVDGGTQGWVKAGLPLVTAA